MAKTTPARNLFHGEQAAGASVPVECLGMKFPSDEVRRAYFLDKLRQKLKDPAFRKIEGFPVADDEDILALSDPPYYTACPNPFLADFITHYGTAYSPPADQYHREPFAADVSEGKYHPFYKLHPYPTKVPHQAIMRYILHYTQPGDLVLDGFCGTGMTGLASQFCASPDEVGTLGYEVTSDGTILDENGDPLSKVGSRPTILIDLCPAATYIAYNYNQPFAEVTDLAVAESALNSVRDSLGWMYATLHRPKPKQLEEALALIKNPGKRKTIAHATGLVLGEMNYTVWSDVFNCPECAGELVFWDAAVNKKGGEVLEEFPCPHCNVNLTKRSLERAWVTQRDTTIKQTIRRAKQVPVLINYSVGTKRFEKKPDAFDAALLQAIEDTDLSYWFPTDRMPEGEESRRNDDIGITHVHHFYSRRNLASLSAFLSKIDRRRDSFTVTRVASQVTNLYRFTYQSGVWGAGGGPLSGTLYVPSLVKELAITKQLDRAIKDQLKTRALKRPKTFCVSTNSSTQLAISSQSIDYIFVDPPFGGNLMYSELLFLSEAWLRVLTNNKLEAVVNSVQGKGLPEYESLMTRCFREFHRVLKPGRWMTVEFHNSQNSIWAAIQEALQRAGFVIADVRILDKKKKTMKQVTGAGTVNKDLIISAYKPNGGLEQRFALEAGSVEGCWDFVRTHLAHLPVKVEISAERQKHLLYDRMIAFHVERGVTVPVSAGDFYAGLEQRFVPRDGMYFLPQQVTEYDKKRMAVKEMVQPELFVTDEATAIQWLTQQLAKKPQTFQEVHPQFLREIGAWDKNEKALELRELLEQSFLCCDGKGEVPSQIHTYLSSNYKELRNLSKDAPALRAKAKDRWYIPDPKKAGDLEKLRERSLLREFEEYRQSRQKKLKVFRLEAVRAGFKKAWDNKDYDTIIAVAQMIPDDVLQEDPKLLMYHDQAQTRKGG
jgi:DNA modification methylase